MTTITNTPSVNSIDFGKCGTTSAMHAAFEDGASLIGIGNLRVMVIREGEKWVAQGVEIDYAVDGGSDDDVKAEFARGLAETLQEHVRVFGDIRRALRRAPEEVWQRFVQCALGERFVHTQMSFADMTIDFYVPKAA